MKLFKSISLILLSCLLSLPITSLFAKTIALETELNYLKNEKIINVAYIHTHEKQLYSATIYSSTDCKSFNKLGTKRNPQLSKFKGGFYTELSNLFEPGLCAVKSTVCLTPSECKDIIVKLKPTNIDMGDKGVVCYKSVSPKIMHINFSH